MVRYFLIHDKDMPTVKEWIPGFNYIELDSHGPNGAAWNVGSLSEDHVSPKPEWIKFPKITDNVTTLAEWDMPHEVLADIGLDGSETCMQAVYKFEAIHPAMG